MAIRIAKSHAGRLRRTTHTKTGAKIPMSKLRATKARAKRTHNTKLMRQVTFAMNARKWQH